MRFLDLNPLALGEIGGERQAGLSIYRDGKWVHGKEAFAHCREEPQSVRFNVWENISVDAAALPGGMRHLADLAMAQLQVICKDLTKGNWTVFTPVQWQKEQLQVFLGIAAACKMDVRMLLPRVLAANHQLSDDLERWTAWEWQWQHLFRIELSRDAQGWTVKELHAVPDGGVMDLFRRDARAVAKVALESHRIDPLHSGKTEQQLFEGWWAHQRSADVWVFNAGDVRLDFQEEAFPSLILSGAEDSAQASASAPLKRCLRWTQAQTERDDLHAVAPRLGDLEKPGARRRNSLPAALVHPKVSLPVTHVVIEGIAKKMGVPPGTRPGQMLRLDEGIEGMAVHVPED